MDPAGPRLTRDDHRHDAGGPGRDVLPAQRGIQRGQRDQQVRAGPGARQQLVRGRGLVRQQPQRAARLYVTLGGYHDGQRRAVCGHLVHAGPVRAGQPRRGCPWVQVRQHHPGALAGPGQRQRGHRQGCDPFTVHRDHGHRAAVAVRRPRRCPVQVGHQPLQFGARAAGQRGTGPPPPGPDPAQAEAHRRAQRPGHVVPAAQPVGGQRQHEDQPDPAGQAHDQAAQRVNHQIPEPGVLDDRGGVEHLGAGDLPDRLHRVVLDLNLQAEDQVELSLLQQLKLFGGQVLFPRLDQVVVGGLQIELHRRQVQLQPGQNQALFLLQLADPEGEELEGQRLRLADRRVGRAGPHGDLQDLVGYHVHVVGSHEVRSADRQLQPGPHPVGDHLALRHGLVGLHRRDRVLTGRVRDHQPGRGLVDRRRHREQGDPEQQPAQRDAQPQPQPPAQRGQQERHAGQPGGEVGGRRLGRVPVVQHEVSVTVYTGGSAAAR